MTSPPDAPAPPVDLPEGVADTIATLDAHNLREAIIYAQELLQARQESTFQIEPQPGEEIVRTTEHPSYTTVVKKQPCGNNCAGCPHGPYVYHVTPEKQIDGRTKLHWALIGQERTRDSTDTSQKE
jgi:hypothetical protein